jgi:hypothetical protein
MSSESQTSDFDLAKKIEDTLKGVEKDRQQRILRWVTESLGLSAVAPQHQVETFAKPGDRGSPRDIKSFVEAKKPKNDTQFAALVAYFYQFEAPEQDRKDSISTDDLKDAARKAKWRQPPKPHATLNNAVAAGYLDRAERGAYRINAVGENLVAMTLPGDQEQPARSARVTRTRKRRSTRPRKNAAPR